MDDLHASGQSLRRRPLCEVADLRRAIPHHVFRSADLSREPARHRGLFFGAVGEALSHGFRQRIKRSTLVDANESWGWRIHAEFAQRLFAQASKLCVGDGWEAACADRLTLCCVPPPVEGYEKFYDPGLVAELSVQERDTLSRRTTEAVRTAKAEWAALLAMRGE